MCGFTERDFSVVFKAISSLGEKRCDFHSSPKEIWEGEIGLSSSLN